MPSEIRLRSNSDAHIEGVSQHILNSSAGWTLRNAEYDTAYGKKVHLPNISPQDIGFDYICRDERDKLAYTCVEFIQKDRNSPFFLVASFINPHDICYMAIRDFAETGPAKHLIAKGRTESSTLDKALGMHYELEADEFFDIFCSPLPDNHEVQ